MRVPVYYQGADKAPLYQVEADGVSKAIYVGDFRNCLFAVIAEDSFDGDIKTRGSIQETMPTSAAAGLTNVWSYFQVTEKNTDDSFDDAGIIYEGSSDGVRTFRINSDGPGWLQFEVDNYVAGKVSVYLVLYNNE